jgi:hypothetical protein
LNVGESFFDLVIGNWDVERRRKKGNEQSTGFNRWMLREEVISIPVAPELLLTVEGGVEKLNDS